MAIRSIILCLLLICWTDALAQSSNSFTAGVRGGFSTSVNQHSFQQFDVFSTWRLPISWQFSSNLTLIPRLEFSAGYLSNHGEDAFIGTFGPVFSLQYASFPVTLETGLRGAGLSRSTFDGRDLGLPFQFISHIGLEGKIAPRLSLSYRLQHMSNLGLGSSNPGLNTHMFGLSYHF